MNIWELHPALVHFPIAFLLSGVVLDFVAWWREKQRLADAATWLLIAGVATGLLAANFGLLAFYTAPHTDAAHQLMFWHPSVAILSLVLFAGVAARRWMRRGCKPSMSVRLISLVGAVTLTIAGYLGGYMVYHGGAGIEPELLADSVRGDQKHSGEDHSLVAGNPSAIKSSEVHVSHHKPSATNDSDYLHTQRENRAADVSEHHPVSAAAGPASQHAPESHEQPSHQQSATDTGDQNGHKTRETERRAADSAKHATHITILPEKKRALEELPKTPSPDAKAAEVPSGYRVEVVLSDLTYPTSIEFDETGAMYVAEGGFVYGDEVARARILRFSSKGAPETVAENLNGPITDLLWHDKRLYISHRSKISVLEPTGVRDLVTGLPSLGDHHNNQLTVGPDGMLYFGQGTATNSGVVGLDNFKGGWLARFPEVHDVPAKDIRLHDQAFKTSNPLVLLADRRMEHEAGGHHKEQKAAGNGAAAGHAGDSTHDNKTTGHEGHDNGSTAAAAKTDSPPNTKAKVQQAEREHAGHSAKDMKKTTGRAGHKKDPAAAKSKTDSVKNAKAKDQQAGAAHAGHSTKDLKKTTGHEGHEKGPEAAEEKRDSAPSSKTKDRQAGTEHADHNTKIVKKTAGHEGHGGSAKKSAQEMKHDSHELVKSYAFAPYGKSPPDDGAVRGTVKASGTILRMNPDGSNLEAFAWGLRNPFGVMWGPDGQLYASDNGYDERGSRPIAHAPDCLWLIRNDAWYGFPDYAGGIPLTDAEFRPENGPPPKFLMRDHPLVEKPLLTLKHHVGAAKIAFGKSETFGFEGQLFLALSGDMNPITGTHEDRSGFEVIRFDPESGSAESFFRAKESALGPESMEYVATAGPRRPVDVQFSQDGNALYVVDVGAIAILPTAAGSVPRPFPGTGVIWRITREGASLR